MIIGFVKGQQFSKKQPVIVSNSINYLEARFVFQTSDWSELVKFAHFKSGDSVYDFLLDGDTIPKEAQLNLYAGNWEVYIHGDRYVVDDDGNEKIVERITTNTQAVQVVKYEQSGSVLPEVGTSVAEQIAAVADNAKKIATSVRNEADAGAFDGKDGYTPVKGIDYFDGNNGVSVTHEWEGTVLKVTSASGTTSADLKGETGPVGPRGPQGEVGPQGEQGPAGPKGESGGIDVQNASPGQMIIVKAVDENGKPTEWEAVDPITGADWNAAEGEPGHVLNRPFYSEYGEETVILPETTITVEEMAPIEYPLFIIAGEEYTVSWNRTVYHCTAVSYSGDGKEGTVLGDFGIITNGVPTTGEPFVLLVFSEEYAATEGFSGIIVPLDGATELTISITGTGETVTPIPKKYLPELRGQKKYVLDLDKGITPALEEVCKLDTAELQASLVCIHEGVEKSVIIVNRTDGYYEGMYIARLDLYVPLTYGKYNYYRWDTISGFQLLEEYWTPEMIEAGMSGTFMLVRQQNEAVPNWRRINEVALPGIVLSSTTQGSTKKFLITVDDSGNLTATQTTAI